MGLQKSRTPLTGGAEQQQRREREQHGRAERDQAAARGWPGAGAAETSAHPWEHG